MNSKEDLRNALKRANRLNQKLKIENEKLKGKVEELELRLRMQKIHCKIFHRQKISVWFRILWQRFWGSKIFWDKTRNYENRKSN